MKSAFSPNWKSSKQPRKQRKYSYNLPSHTASANIVSHISPELKEKHKIRSIRIRVGDKVKVVRGQFKGESSKVERIDVQRRKVYITKIETIKKDGTKALVPLEPSNLIVTELNLDDNRRLKAKKGEVKNG